MFNLDIMELMHTAPWVVTNNIERLQEMVNNIKKQ